MRLKPLNRGMAIVLIAAFLGGLLLMNILPPRGAPYSLTPLDADEKARLDLGNVIGRALVSFAHDHNGHLPESLDQLQPKYLPTEAPVSQFELYYPGEKLREVNNPLIASDKAPFRRTGARRMVLIKADGGAYLLTPGD